MAEIIRKVISVFAAFRDGREKGIGLDRAGVAREHKIGADSDRALVRVSREAVGVIEGELREWWKEPGNPGGTKLHWVCPECGLQQWGDWTPEVPNPCLWYSGCHCIDKWLIHWHGDKR